MKHAYVPPKILLHPVARVSNTPGSGMCGAAAGGRMGDGDMIINHEQSLACQEGKKHATFKRFGMRGAGNKHTPLGDANLVLRYIAISPHRSRWWQRQIRRNVSSLEKLVSQRSFFNITSITGRGAAVHHGVCRWHSKLWRNSRLWFKGFEIFQVSGRSLAS